MVTVGCVTPTLHLAHASHSLRPLSALRTRLCRPPQPQGQSCLDVCYKPIAPRFFLLSPPIRRINTALTFAIRLAKNPPTASTGPSKEYKRINNENRPDQAFVTDRAQRSGRANAASGRIMVTIPNDHFGPITAEHDPTRNQVWEVVWEVWGLGVSLWMAAVWGGVGSDGDKGKEVNGSEWHGEGRGWTIYNTSLTVGCRRS